jgi:glycosyltransferase involved in cell wall biosynthesis
MDQLRVLLVTPSYDPIVGGTEAFVRRLATKLNALGTRTDIMTFNMVRKWKPVWRETIESGEFRVFKIPGVANPFNFLPINPLYLIFRISAIPKPSFTKIFDDYDIIHFLDEVELSFPLFSFLTQKPKVMQCLTPSAFESIRSNFFSKRIFRRIADVYITSLPSHVKDLLGMGIPHSRILMLGGLGVDEETFKPDETKKLDDLILFVGRLQKSKGVHLLLQALLYLKIPTHVVIIGPFDQQDPHYSNEIKKIRFSINEEGLHKVELLGSLNESKLLSWYQKAAVFIRPDLDSLSGGLTSLEALACGTPIIGTGNDIVKDKVNGVLVKPNPVELANAIQMLITNGKLRKKYGEMGRRMVEQSFSFNQTIGKLTLLYEKLSIQHSVY